MTTGGHLHSHSLIRSASTLHSFYPILSRLTSLTPSTPPLSLYTLFFFSITITPSFTFILPLPFFFFFFFNDPAPPEISPFPLHAALPILVPPLRRCPPMMRNDQLVLVQEHVANRDRLIQQAARVPAHVQDQAIQRGRIQLLQCIRDLAIRRLVKSRQPDIANARLQHERAVHRMPRDLIARHRETQLRGITFARNRNLDNRAFRPLQHIRYFAGGQSIRGFVVDFDDHVARPDPRIVLRRSHVRRQPPRVMLARRYHHSPS